MTESKKTCFNCAYEPEWSEPVGVEYPRRSGRCKWSGTLPPLPKTYRVDVGCITIFSDGSGVAINCKTWKRKEGKL